MKNSAFLITLLLLFSVATGFSQVKIKNLRNPVFAFNNALNKKDLPFIEYKDQAAMLERLGYNGIEHKETSGIFDALKAFKKQGLAIYTDYLKIDIDSDEPYLSEWKKVIPKLKNTGIILWVHIHSEKYKPSDEAADELVVPILQELADLAEPYGVQLAVYHHLAFLAEKAEDSYRLAVKTNRENVGSVFNLCHFLKTDSEENIVKAIETTLPKLFAVSVSGANSGDTQKMNWDQLIQPLGEGTFDVYRVVEMLADRGFQGPIGVQCYNLKGEPEEYLKKSMEAWESFKLRYSKPVNSLSFQEKVDGWQLLFDGVSTKYWRGINQDSFPKSGWKIENGDLIANVHGGAESGAGGDIITEEKYSNFILKWEWNMKTKGGNSGLKYFVQEGLGENKGYGFGLEYQLLDDKYHEWMLSGKMQPNDYHTLGALYEIYPASVEKHPNPLGLWNESMIVSDGSHVEHWLNGMKILEYDRVGDDFKARIAASKFKNTPGYGVVPEGHLLLQDHGSIVHFRNIKIKKL